MPYRSITLCAFALLAMFSVANSQADNAFARETFSAELVNLTPLRVVTTFTILQDLVSELGGGHVDVMNLVGPNGDAHTYQPKPSDAIALKQAELVVFNGLGFEGWLPRLMDTVNYDNRRLAASEGVDAIFLDNEPDPHAWQSFRNIRIYVDNISQTLVDLLPKHSLSLKARRKQYISRIDMLEQEFLRRFGEIPPKDRVVVTSHDKSKLCDGVGLLESELVAKHRDNIAGASWGSWIRDPWHTRCGLKPQPELRSVIE